MESTGTFLIDFPQELYKKTMSQKELSLLTLLRQRAFGSLPLSYQFRMTFNRRFYPLRFDADVTLRHGGGAVLSEPPDGRKNPPNFRCPLCSKREKDATIVKTL